MSIEALRRREVRKPAKAKRRISLVAVIVAMAMVNLIMGITFPLTALVLARQGVETSWIGLNAAMQALPVLFMTPLTPRLIKRFGPAATMFTGLVIAAMALPLMGLFPSLPIWFPLRALLGVAGCLLWATSEAWIHAMVEDDRRGRMMGIYSASAAAGFSAGPVILVLVGTNGVLPFLIGGGAMLLGAVLMAFADWSRGHFDTGRKGAPVWGLVFLAPAALLANFFFAAAEESVTSFFSLYALQFGMPEKIGLALLTIAALGAIALQFPIGWLADKMNRMALMVLLIALTIVGYATLPFVLPGVIATGIAIFFIVGIATGIYTVGMVLMGERFTGGELAGASALTTAMWGLGALVGAPFSGAAMELWHPHGLIAAVILLYLAYLPFPLIAWRRERAATDMIRT
ncbi:MAG: MFS transporter [Parvibaculaceae bacterium]|nr:MFS transporter [Parvibaculaceae bacterium]